MVLLKKRDVDADVRPGSPTELLRHFVVPLPPEPDVPQSPNQHPNQIAGRGEILFRIICLRDSWGLWWMLCLLLDNSHHGDPSSTS